MGNILLSEYWVFKYGNWDTCHGQDGGVDLWFYLNNCLFKDILLALIFVDLDGYDA